LLSSKIQATRQFHWHEIRRRKNRNRKARAGKNSWWTSTLQPPSFLPACWKPPAIFSDGGGTERRKEREVALAPALPCAGDNKELP